MATMSSHTRHLYEFGPFRLDAQRRVLLREKQPVGLTPKALETLLVLVENRDRVVSKDELMKTLWPDSFVEESNLSQNIFVLRKALGDSAQDRRYILTVPGRGYQFTETVREVGEQTEDEALVLESRSLAQVVVEQPVGSLGRFWVGLAALVVVVIVLLGGIYVRGVRADKLKPDDTIVLGDFANSTGDPVFDDTLKQGLTMTLGQSPFLNILPQSKVSKTLRLMTRDSNSTLTPELANEVCQRSGSKAYVAGAIGSLGSEYVVGLKAVNCHSGDTLAQEQVTAARKEDVLVTLGSSATRLRSELGESLSTVQKFGVPLTEATTSSLEALREYSQGLRIWYSAGETDAIPHLKRAIELDPNFASAYSSLGAVYSNLGLTTRGAEYMTKAYQLRDRTSERERLYILGHYYTYVTGELEKSIPTYKQWIEEYPSEPTPHTNLANDYQEMGRFENALTEHQQALRIEPNGVLIYENLALNYAILNRPDDAIATVNQAFSRQLDDVTLHLLLMQLSFQRGDTATVQQQFQWGMKQTGSEDGFLAMQSDIEAAAGHLTKARDFTHRAVQAALQSGSKDSAAYWQGEGAWREAEMGNLRESVKQANAALTMSRDRFVLLIAALALARAGERDRAKALAEQLDHDLPQGTLMQFYFLPSIRSVMDLNRHDGAKALQTLQPTGQCEMCFVSPLPGLLPTHLRARALLESHQGAAAATEFQKLLSHRTMLDFFSLNLLNLELGRAYALSADKASAKKSYQDFFTLWKDADADISALKAAKLEYAKLQ